MYPYSLQDPPPALQPNPYFLPARIVSGDSFLFRFQTSALYNPTEGWSMQLSLRPVNGNEPIDINSSVDLDFLFEATPTVTSSWDAGRYAVQLYALKSGKRSTVLEALVEVVANLDAVHDQTDLRTHA